MRISDYIEIVPNRLYIKENFSGNLESLYVRRQLFSSTDYINQIHNIISIFEKKKKEKIKSIYISDLERILLSFSEESIEYLKDYENIEKMMYDYEIDNFDNKLPSNDWLWVEKGFLPDYFKDDISDLESGDIFSIYLDYMHNDEMDKREMGILESAFKLFIYGDDLKSITDKEINFFKEHGILQSNEFFIEHNSERDSLIYNNIADTITMFNKLGIKRYESTRVHDVELVLESFKYTLEGAVFDEMEHTWD